MLSLAVEQQSRNPELNLWFRAPAPVPAFRQAAAASAGRQRLMQVRVVRFLHGQLWTRPREPLLFRWSDVAGTCACNGAEPATTSVSGAATRGIGAQRRARPFQPWRSKPSGR